MTATFLRAHAPHLNARVDLGRLNQIAPHVGCDGEAQVELQFQWATITMPVTALETLIELAQGMPTAQAKTARRTA